MQMTRVIERSFHLETALERDVWVKVYEDTRKLLETQRKAPALVDPSASLISRFRGISFVEKGPPKVQTINYLWI